jgi:hypothetical protein
MPLKPITLPEPTFRQLTMTELRRLELINNHTLQPDGSTCILYGSVRQRNSSEPKRVPYMRIGNKTLTVASVVFELFYCQVPEGQRVRHKCTSPCCINPQHLTLRPSPVTKMLPPRLQETIFSPLDAPNSATNIENELQKWTLAVLKHGPADAIRRFYPTYAEIYQLQKPLRQLREAEEDIDRIMRSMLRLQDSLRGKQS